MQPCLNKFLYMLNLVIYSSISVEAETTDRFMKHRPYRLATSAYDHGLPSQRQNILLEVQIVAVFRIK